MNTIISDLVASLVHAATPLTGLPLTSQALIVVGALAFWPVVKILWTTLRWLRDLIRPNTQPVEVSLKASSDNYIWG